MPRAATLVALRTLVALASLKFGTDGVRGVANQELTPELALVLGRAAARVLGGSRWLIGQDGRRSGALLGAALAAGFLSDSGRFREAVTTPGVRLFEVPNTAERARVAGRARALDGPAEALAALKGPTALGIDPRREALVLKSEAAGLALPGLDGSRRAQLTQDAPGRLRIYFHLYPNLPDLGGTLTISGLTVDGQPADVAYEDRRYLLRVNDAAGRPVLDARVRIFDGEQQVFEGRTYAGGKTVFFPRVAGVSGNAQQLRVLVEKGNSTVEGTLARGQASASTFVLRDAQAAPATPRLDVLFLLDATGSMGDEIAQIQQTIASIAERIDASQPRPELRFALVAYRDRGDAYVTQVHDFTPDVAQFRETLLATSAGGCGDDPESLNEALHAAVAGVRGADNAVRLTFLVADAPPHLDYPNDYDYVQEARNAVAQGIKVYTIAASNSGDEAEYVLRQIAQQTLAHFIFLTYQPGQNSGAPGETTVHQVDPQSFTVERLDDLVVQVVQHELAAAQGAA